MIELPVVEPVAGVQTSEVAAGEEATRIADAATHRNRGFVRSVFSFLVGQGLSWIGSAVLVVLLPRYLGDVGLGKLGFALALTLLAGLFVNLGTPTYLMKEVARRPADAAILTGNAILTRIPLSLATAGLTALGVRLAHIDGTTRAVVYVLCGWIVVDSLRGVIQASLQGLQRMTALAAFPVVTNSVYAGTASAVLLRGGGSVGVAAAYVCGQLTGLIMNTAVLLRRLRPELRPSLRICAQLLVGGMPFFIWQAALVVYGQIDAVLLSLLTTYAVVGWYLAAYRIMSVPIFIPAILITVVFPALSAAASRPAETASIARGALRAALLASLPLALGVTVLAPQLIKILGYPTAFENSILPIVLLAPSFPLVALDMVIGTVLNTTGKQNRWAMAAVAAAIFNPVMNLGAIPLTQSLLHNGAVGAAAVTTATEVFLMVVGLRLLPPGLIDARTSQRVLRCLAAGATMVAVVLPLRDLPIAIPTVAGGLAYGIAALLFGALSWGEVAEVGRHLITRRQLPKAAHERGAHARA